MDLICFPHAGGSSAAFFQIKRLMPPEINLHLLEYPGHGKYFQKPLIYQFQPMLEYLLREVTSILQEPFTFYGHSMGALLSFEVVRRLYELKMPMPTHLFVSGRTSPQTEYKNPPLSHLADDDFLFVLQNVYKGIPTQISSEASLLKIFLPILKADFAILENYNYVEKLPLPLPIIAIAGDRDPVVNEEQLGGWSQHTSSTFKRVMIPGDHFSIITEPSHLVGQILSTITTPEVHAID